MRLQFLLLLIYFIGCSNSEELTIHGALVKYCNETAKENGTDVQIEELKIIDSKKIGWFYVEETLLENLKRLISLREEKISLLEEQKKLFKKEIRLRNRWLENAELAEQLKYEDEIEEFQNELQTIASEIPFEKSEVKRLKDEIFKIIRNSSSYPGDRDSSLLKIRYFLKADYGSKKINDTIEVVSTHDMKDIFHFSAEF